MIVFIEKIKVFFSTDAGESFAAFVSGGVPATIVSYQLLEGIVIPMVLATLTGLVGGMAALLGKDLYKWIKIKLFKDTKDNNEQDVSEKQE